MTCDVTRQRSGSASTPVDSLTASVPGEAKLANRFVTVSGPGATVVTGGS